MMYDSPGVLSNSLQTNVHISDSQVGDKERLLRSGRLTLRNNPYRHLH